MKPSHTHTHTHTVVTYTSQIQHPSGSRKLERKVNNMCTARYRVYSRLSLFRLSEVRPPRYTGHLAWHGMLAICLLHKTRPEVRPLAIPYTGQCWLSQTRFQCNFTRVLRPDIDYYNYDCLSFIILETRPQN